MSMISMKSLYLFLILSMLGTASGGSSAALNIVPKYIEADANETFIISIDINPYDNSIHGAKFELLYNRSLLEVISIKKGQFLSQDGMQTNPVSGIDNNIGKIQYAETRAGNTGVKNPGSIAVIAFRVKESAKGGNQSFILKNVVVTDDSQKELPVELSGGDFRVVGEMPARTPQPERKISQELSDIMNKTGDTEKILVIIYIGEKDAIQNLVNFLNSRGNEVSDINQLSDSITARVSKKLILEINSMPFVTRITVYREAVEKQQPGFGIVISAVILMLIYIKIKKYREEHYE